MKTKLVLFLSSVIHISAFSQWIQTGGPTGGDTFEIVQIDSELFLSTGIGGIYKSVDDGKTWALSSIGLPCNELVETLVEHNGNLYVAISRSGIYTSIDKGETWIPINSGVENLTFYSLFVDGSNIYAGEANGGVYYSPDNGQSWANKSNGVATIHFKDFITFNSKVYAAGEFLYETSNNGDSWIKLNLPNLNQNGIRAVTVNNNVFYAASDGKVYISTDNMISWNERIINNNGSSIIKLINHNSLVYLTTALGTYFYTNDNGINWTSVKNTNTNNFVNNLFFTNNSIIMSTRDGLYESSDLGASWFRSNNGIANLGIDSMAKNNSYIFAGTLTQGIFRSIDNGQSWVSINNGLTGLNTLHINKIDVIGNVVFITTDAGLYSSTNDGNSWELKFYPGLNYQTEVFDYNNGNFVTAVNGVGVFLSSDNGTTWVQTQTNGLNTQTAYYSILIDGNVIIISTHNGEVFKSTDLGNTWKNISIISNNYLTFELELFNNTLYAATNKGLMISKDLGDNWTAFNNDVKYINDILFDSEKIYIGTSMGVYVADQQEKKWYPLCEGIGHLSAQKLLLSDNVLYMGTYGLSVWKRYKVEGNLPPTGDPSTIGIEEIDLCSGSSPVNLFSEMGISPNSQGIWTPNLTNSNGIFDPALDSPGIYTFLFNNDICGCENYRRVVVNFDAQPSAGNNSEVILCKENGPINLFDNIEGNPDLGGIWSPQLTSGSNIFDLALDSPGIYTYTINSSCGIYSSEVTVSLSQPYQISNYIIEIENHSNLNTIIITVNDNSQYEYSLDGLTYQDSNVFNNVFAGNYTIYGKEINGCGFFQRDIFILDYPRFFTPNGDGFNDVWEIKGDSNEKYILYIFDRFGKLLKELNETNYYWDGDYNGNPMPSSDYWFKLYFEDGRKVTGHFTLERK